MLPVDFSGCKWVLASFILDEIKVIKNLLSIIYFRLMKMISYKYETAKNQRLAKPVSAAPKLVLLFLF